MEIYAAFGEVTDYEIGRFLDSIDALGVMDNALIFYITGDNGPVFQGGPTGAFNEMSVFNATPEPLEIALAHLDDFGGPDPISCIRMAGRSPAPRPLRGVTRWPPTAASVSPSWFSGRRESKRRAACGHSGTT